MPKSYTHLQAEERAAILIQQQQGCSLRQIARSLGRDVSSISRELSRNRSDEVTAYDPVRAGARAERLRNQARHPGKLASDSVLFGVVAQLLRWRWSPEQIAGTLRRIYPDRADLRVCHETIYTALYAMPRGELRKELIACLRHHHTSRRPRSAGLDRRGQLPDMQSLSQRPAEANDRRVPGHWEADLIKGAGNRSAVGTLVERTTRLLILAHMPDASAASALAGFTAALNQVSEPMRKTLAYDQGREMSLHRQLTERTGVQVYFCDPHSPWQRGSNENTNGLLRQYLPKGTDLSVYSQAQLDAIANEMNHRPRKVLGFRTPLEAYAEILIQMREAQSATIH